MSFMGGKIRINGGEISSSSIIKVGGLVGRAIEVTDSFAVLEVPPLITPEVLQNYLEIVKTSKLKHEEVISESIVSTADRAFDGIYSTGYFSPVSNGECFIGIDLGENMHASVHRIRYFPYNKWSIVSNYMLGGVFEGSTDGVSYI